MILRLQPVQVGTGSNDIEGRLVFADDLLVAVLVQLSDDHEEQSGKWFFEAGFGNLNVANPLTFADLDEARRWITQKLLTRFNAASA